jgi:putative transposase
MVSASVRRLQVAFARERGLPVRRACALLKTARSGLSLTSKRAARDAPTLSRMRELAGEHPRKGYRFVRMLLAREGNKMSAERALRLWQVGKLQVPRKRARRRIASERPRPKSPSARNHVWAIDFVFDWTADSRVIKCLTVIDEWTRECLAIDVSGNIRSSRVIQVLARLVSVHGAPRYL